MHQDMRRILTLLVLLLGAQQAFSQQEILQSQYMFNGLFINPAYAGSHSFAEATALHRSQWVGFDGAPRTQTFGIEGPLKDKFMGLGLTVINDRIGDTRQTEVFANWAYHLLLDDQGRTRVSFGIRAGFADYTANLAETTVFDSGDPIFTQNIGNQFVPKFGAGVYFYSKMWYAGISVPTLYAADNNVRFNINDVSDRYFRPHTYLTAGYVYVASESIKIKPSFLLRYLNNAPLQADLNCNFLFKDTFWLGVSYRTGDAIVGLFELNVLEDFRIGYAYDFTTTQINQYSSGSHEVMLSYKFGKDPVKTKSPRYF